MKNITTVVFDEDATYTLVEVSEELNISAELLNEMQEYGLFEVIDERHEALIDQESLRKIESACRLHQDLGVNLPGVVLALELLDEIEDLRQQLAILERK
ncbi:MAG: hypothetical protein A3F18_07990 [Legionellales bacterium RIFCSPHIGHO2_12_FULL_37_14]|nr:MAG: hypothetical protein A3F18_07990 [Legionellales bacterium RIFCSPHIGHO2_12_FULL_37_14]